MVCNIVTYRARSVGRGVGYALGFPRPLVDRVAKALETYDSVMVRRDLEADGGFGQFFADTVEREAAAVGGMEGSGGAAGGGGAARAAWGEQRGSGAPPTVLNAAETAAERGLVDRMGQLNPPHGGRIGKGGAREARPRHQMFFQKTGQGTAMEIPTRE